MVKISDVAKYAEVSVSTVSRILSRDETFSATKETIDRVKDAVEQLGYTPLRTRSKSKSKTKNLSIIMTATKEDEELDPYWSEIRINIVDEARKNGYVVNQILHFNEKLINEDLLSSDAYIVLGSTTLETLNKYGLKSSNTIIVDNSNVYTNGFDRVTSDLYESTIKNIKQLMSYGHQKIGFIGGNVSVIDSLTNEFIEIEDMRSKAYTEFMKLNNMFDDQLMILGDWKSKAGYEMAKTLISRNIKLTAIITASDPIALGVVHALREEGIKVPEDISIISFDNIEASAFMSPPLSTVDLNSKELGRQAVSLLNQRIEGRDIPIKVVVQSNLIERESIKTLEEVVVNE